MKTLLLLLLLTLSSFAETELREYTDTKLLSYVKLDREGGGTIEYYFPNKGNGALSMYKQSDLTFKYENARIVYMNVEGIEFTIKYRDGETPHIHIEDKVLEMSLDSAVVNHKDGTADILYMGMIKGEPINKEEKYDDNTIFVCKRIHNFFKHGIELATKVYNKAPEIYTEYNK